MKRTILIAVIFIATTFWASASDLGAFRYYMFTNDFTNGFYRHFTVNRSNVSDSLFRFSYRYEIFEIDTKRRVHYFGFTNWVRATWRTNVRYKVVTNARDDYLWAWVTGSVAVGMVAGIIIMAVVQ